MVGQNVVTNLFENPNLKMFQPRNGILKISSRHMLPNHHHRILYSYPISMELIVCSTNSFTPYLLD